MQDAGGAHSEEPSDGEQETAEISAPLVFSCATCRTIVGDSFSILKINENLGSITLNSASNIRRSTNVFTSKDGPDIGSTYMQFFCNKCDAAIGRYYLTTSPHIDFLRGKFSFIVNEITSYELGKSQIGKALPESINFTEGSPADDEMATDKTFDSSPINELSSEIQKVHRSCHPYIPYIFILQRFLPRLPYLGTTRHDGHSQSAGDRRGHRPAT
jgi:hypothetical protein